MAKFGKDAQTPQPSGRASAPPRQRPLPAAKTTGTTVTHQGGAGITRDPRSELFLTAVSSLVEDTYYESADARIARVQGLVREVLLTNPDWLEAFIPYLRGTLNLRSMATLLAAEYAASRGPRTRQVIRETLQRADEPGEFLAYWQTHYPRNRDDGRIGMLPGAVGRGVADAVVKLYSEYSALKYDGQSVTFRFGDVIELCHPKPKDAQQGALFKWCLDRRHHADDGKRVVRPTDLRPEFSLREVLPTIGLARELDALDPEVLRKTITDGSLAAAQLDAAGYTWERLSSKLPGGLGAGGWNVMIPTMGYMALLRNLRNFDLAGISPASQQYVIEKLANAEEVAKSRQLPIRFFSAYKEISTLQWAPALETALELSLQNIPSLPGRTLVLMDLSGSMWSPVSGRSDRLQYELACLFGCALAKRAASADVYGFDQGIYKFDDYRRTPLLRLVDEASKFGGGGTYIRNAVATGYEGHDRVVILSDEQAAYEGPDATQGITCPVYTFNLAGYGRGWSGADEQKASGPRHTFGGMTDACFALIPTIEAGPGQVGA